MIKKGSRQVNIIANEKDLHFLAILEEKLGLKKTQIYRLALAEFYRKEKEVD